MFVKCRPFIDEDRLFKLHQLTCWINLQMNWAAIKHNLLVESICKWTELPLITESLTLVILENLKAIQHIQDRFNHIKDQTKYMKDHFNHIKDLRNYMKDHFNHMEDQTNYMKIVSITLRSVAPDQHVQSKQAIKEGHFYCIFRLKKVSSNQKSSLGGWCCP